MIAYRLHLEPASLEALRLVRAGAVGQPRLITAVNTQQVKEGDVRLMPFARGGGTLYDIGIYCINAARHLFAAEPEAVWAASGRRDAGRFKHIRAKTYGWLRLSDDRMATFLTSFAAAKVNFFQVMGSQGALRLDPAFTFRGGRRLSWAEGGRSHERSFPDGDQFGPELLYFSDCVLQGLDPRPGGLEGLNDVLVIEALHRSLVTGDVMPVELAEPPTRPDPDGGIYSPPVVEPDMMAASEPGGDR